MKKLRILSINHTEEFEGGTEVFKNKFCKELRKRGHKVLELTLSKNFGEIKKEKIVLKVVSNNVLRKFLGVTFYPSLYRKIKRIIKDFKPDIIHFHNIEKFPLTILLASKRNKIVKTINDYGIICPTMWCIKKKKNTVCEAGFGFKCLKCLNVFEFAVHFVLSVVKNKFYKKYIGAFISPSKLQYEYITKHGYRNVFLLENFLLYDKISKFNKNKKIKKNYFLYIGQITKQKGIEVMANAFLKFSKNKNFKLIVIGGGPEKEKYEKKFSSEKIKFLGRVDDTTKFTYMQNALAIIIPSLWMETGPHVGMEAMLLNKPIISSDIGGMTDYVIDKKNGLFFRRGSSEDLAQKLIFFVKNKKIFKDIYKTNKGVLRKYSVEHFIKGLLTIYEKVM